MDESGDRHSRSRSRRGGQRLERQPLPLHFSRLESLLRTTVGRNSSPRTPAGGNPVERLQTAVNRRSDSSRLWKTFRRIRWDSNLLLGGSHDGTHIIALLLLFSDGSLRPYADPVIYLHMLPYYYGNYHSSSPLKFSRAPIMTSTSSQHCARRQIKWAWRRG